MRALVLAALLIKSVVLSPDGTDVYTFAADNDGVVTASAPVENEGGSLRRAFWLKGTPVALNASSCATWTSESDGIVQQGAALRIVKGQGYKRAVTVTKNVYFGATWIFNLHVWDTREEPRAQIVAQFDMSEELRPNGKVAPLPWRLCARTVGATLEFKVWRSDEEPEPPWGNSVHGASSTVPAEWVEAGKVGLYVAHIPPGGSATFADITTIPVS